jgi:hypothetical protein
MRTCGGVEALHRVEWSAPLPLAAALILRHPLDRASKDAVEKKILLPLPAIEPRQPSPKPVAIMVQPSLLLFTQYTEAICTY